MIYFYHLVLYLLLLFVQLILELMALEFSVCTIEYGMLPDR